MAANSVRAYYRLIGILLTFVLWSLSISSPRALAAEPARGVQVDLSRFFNNDGIATSDDPTNGSLDGSGYSYPAEFLPAPGPVTLGGISFIFPGSRPHEKNNIAAEGQRIELPPGRYHAASIIVTSTYGDSSGEFTLHYDDGTTARPRFHVADWYSGSSSILTMPFRYTSSGGKDPHLVFLNAARLGLDYRRSLVGITLPQAPDGRRRFHMFALTLHPIVRGIHIEIFDLEQPRITMEERAPHTLRVNIQNLGTSWISGAHKLRVAIEAPGVTTTSAARVDFLAPGEVIQGEIHLATALPRGTEVSAVVRVTGRSGIREFFPIKLILGAPDYDGDVRSLARHSSPYWFENAKFGIFIHWGVYSVPAWAPVAGVFAEWYWESMNSPESATYAYHHQTYGTAFGYDDFIAQFQPSRFDAKEWVQLIRESGARYFVFTAKHHDGFAMYDSSTTNRDSAALGPQRDPLRELFVAAEAHAPDMKRGIYYSLFEWYHPARTGRLPINPYTSQPLAYTGATPVDDFVDNHVLPQLRELIDRYDPDILWCDGQSREGAGYWKTAETVAHFYNQAMNRPQPRGVAVNDRCSVTDPQRSAHGADFLTIEYETFPTTVQKKWEMTRGLDPHSFGFNSQTPEDAYMTANEAIDLLSDVVSKNGNLLLNIGPASDGSVPRVMREVLLEIGAWLRTNGEAIYDTTYWWRTPEEGNLRFTRRGNEAFYVIALEWPGKELVIDSPIPIRPGYSIQLLGDGNRQLKWYQLGGRLIIDLPPGAQSASQHAWVFRIR